MRQDNSVSARVACGTRVVILLFTWLTRRCVGSRLAGYGALFPVVCCTLTLHLKTLKAPDILQDKGRGARLPSPESDVRNNGHCSRLLKALCCRSEDTVRAAQCLEGSE
jgi:hypothetical protein